MGVSYLTKHGPFLIGMLLVLPIKPMAQSFYDKRYYDPFSVNVVGGCNAIRDIVFDWSVGESPIVQKLSTQNHLLLTAGFLQNLCNQNIPYEQLDSFALQIKVGPNPFTNRISISLHQDGINISSIQLLNFYGKSIYKKEGLFSGLYFNHEFDVIKLNNPICYLIVEYTVYEKIYKSRIYKLIQN